MPVLDLWYFSWKRSSAEGCSGSIKCVLNASNPRAARSQSVASGHLATVARNADAAAERAIGRKCSCDIIIVACTGLRCGNQTGAQI